MVMLKEYDETFKLRQISIVQTHPQEECLDFATVLSCLLLCVGKKDVFGRNARVRDALPVTYHPYENIRDAVLRLQ